MEDVSSQVEEVKEVTQKVPAEELATKDELQALADKLPAEGGGLTPQELGERVEAMEKKAEEAAANEVPISSILHTANRTVSERMFCWQDGASKADIAELATKAELQSLADKMPSDDSGISNSEVSMLRRPAATVPCAVV